MAMILVALSARFAPAKAATPANEARTVDELATAQFYPAPRAFVRGNNVRIYYPQNGRPMVFQAEWKRLRLEGRDFAYRQAELKYDPLPPKLPKPDGTWHEATVFGQAEWEHLAQQAAERLTGWAPWQGTFLQFLDTERVLYRDDAGQLHAVPPHDTPDPVKIGQRYNAQEFAVTLSLALEASLKTAAHDQHLFMIVNEQPGRLLRFILLDTAKRRCVLLYAPEPEYTPKGGPQLVSSARMWSSLLLESHGLALLKNPFSAVGRLVNLSFQNLAGLLDTGLPSFKLPPPPVIRLPGMDLTAWERDLDDLLGSPSDRGTVKLLINGEEFFPHFERRLVEAEHSIDLLVCIFDRDDVAVAVADQLKRRAAEVAVRIIHDRMNSQGAGNSPPATPMRPGFVPPNSIGAYLEHESQVRVRPFLNPWFTSEHSKVFLIDDQYAYLGGMNIGREYRYEWHDLMMEIEGPIVARFAQDFDRAWAHASLLGDFAYAGQALLGRRRPAASDPNRPWPPLRRLYTRTTDTQIRRAVMAALNRAQQRVYLENTYLYDNQIVGALATARQRGVDVRVVLPSDSDFDSADSSNYVTANYLLANGVRVFVYPGMTHVKALIVDGWACLGSANFNRLSLRFNQEVNVATSDPATVASLCRRLFEVDFAKSRELKESIKVSWTDHFAEYLLNHL